MNVPVLLLCLIGIFVVTTDSVPMQQETSGKQANKATSTKSKKMFTRFDMIKELKDEQLFPKPTSEHFKNSGCTKFQLLEHSKQQPYVTQQKGQRGKTRDALKRLFGHMGVTPWDLLEDFLPKSVLEEYASKIFNTSTYNIFPFNSVQRKKSIY